MKLYTILQQDVKKIKVESQFHKEVLFQECMPLKQFLFMGDHDTYITKFYLILVLLIFVLPTHGWQCFKDKSDLSSFRYFVRTHSALQYRINTNR